MDLEHGQFEQLCVLVAAAEASPDEIELFSEHCENCFDCQRKLAEYETLISAMYADGTYPENGDLENAEDLSLRLKARKAALMEAIERPSEVVVHKPAHRSVKRRAMDGLRWMEAGSIAAAVIVGIVFFSSGKPAAPVRVENPPQQAAGSPVPAQPPIALKTASRSADSSDAKEAGRWKQELETERAQVKELSTLVAALKSERDKLLEELGDAHQKQTLAQQQAQDLENARQQASGGVAKLEADLTRLYEKVRLQEALLARQQRLLSVDIEVHNLLGDPELRVLDVQSVNVRGQVERPFGRVFFVPEKALVMYAFDLDQRFGARPGEKFDVWGSEGVQMGGGRRLGSLEIDQKEQNRWLLRFADAATLSQIDTVYVTVTGTGPLSPVKPVLRAYLADAH